jgi:carboxymethylenebutenolidase
MGRTEFVKLTVADGTEMQAFVARPGGSGPHPGLLVLQEALGVNAQIRGVASRYAEQGFVAIAPDLFHRTAPGYEADVLDMAALMPLVRTLTTDGLLADMRAAHAWLVSQPEVDDAGIAAVGFCMGGRAAYLANSVLPLAAAVSYYAGGLTPELLERAVTMSGPHLFFWGGKDRTITPDKHRAVADAFRAAGKPFVDVEFSEADHAFFNERIDRYDPAAAEQSWALATAFLRRAVSPNG